MRRLLATTLLAATAFTLPASADDCVTSYVTPITFDETGWVEVDQDDLSVHAYPGRAVTDAALLAVRTAILVNCIV